MNQTCTAAAAHCRCGRLDGHDGPHSCQDRSCGGMWHGDIDTETFEVVRFPMAGMLL